VLRVLKLKKYYGRIRGIEDVSFEIDEGVIYGLIGPNGAGKTTTIRTIIGMIKADEGEVYIISSAPESSEIHRGDEWRVI